MRHLHAGWVYVAVAATGSVGLWGLALAIMRRTPGPRFRWAAYGAVGAMLLQVAFGLVLYADDAYREAVDSLHVFYGMVALFTFAFLYIFRIQVERRPALVWGVVLLFVMGLGIRAWTIVA
jgi:hypothetical protein